MKNLFFCSLERKIDSLADKTLERWSERTNSEEFEHIEAAILSFKWDSLKVIEKALKNKGLQ